MRTFMDYDEQHTEKPFLTIQEFAAIHRGHFIIEQDENAMHAETFSMEEIEQMAGDRGIVEYLGRWNDSDNLWFVITPISKRNKPKRSFEVLVSPY